MTSPTQFPDAKEILAEKSQQSSPCSQVEFCKSDIEAQSAKSGRGHRHWLRRLLTKPPSKGQHTVKATEDPYLPRVQALDPKTKGYDQLAIFQASDRNFLQYRSFRTLHCRVVSDLQYRVERLESELNRIDKHDRTHSEASQKMLISKQIDNASSESAILNRQYPARITRGRPEVLKEIKSKLLEYDEMLLKTKEVMALQRPTKRDYTSLVNWHRQNQPILQTEALPILRLREDIITLRDGRESAGLDAFVETCLSRMDRVLQVRLKCDWVQRLFLTQDLRNKNPKGDVKFFSPNRIDILVNIIITAVIFVLLILPVVVMYEVTNIGRGQSPLNAIGILIVFTLIFGMAVSSLTTARRHELFAASAAYAAVLVVFIGNFGVQQVSILS